MEEKTHRSFGRTAIAVLIFLVAAWVLLGFVVHIVSALFSTVVLIVAEAAKESCRQPPHDLGVGRSQGAKGARRGGAFQVGGTSPGQAAANAGWDDQGRLVTSGLGFRPSLWRFTAERERQE